jgi:subtilase family serine protease
MLRKGALVNGSLKLAAPLVLAIAAAACNGGSPSVPAASDQTAGSSRTIPYWQATHSAVAACPGSRIDQFQCDALIEKTGISRDTTIHGWTPPTLESYYNLPVSSKGSGQVVAVVDAYDNPNVASDLAEFRSEFDLGTANFTKYNQDGQTKNYPTGNTGWGVEIDLDVEMVSTSCPNCTIYLIEANNNSNTNLYDAEEEAVKLGATIVTNSWGGGGGSPSGGAFDASGVTFLASAGDNGYGMQDPADYDTVVSVGGTTLMKSGSPPAYSEQVWIDSGGGCSVVTKPSWQHDPTCTNRTGNDISAIAAGVAEYDTYNEHGWITIGGTSVASPLMAGVFGLAGNSTKQDGGKRFWLLKKKKVKKYLHYISKGTVRGCPASLTGSYLCTAGTGQYKTYSGPSGWGTPNGIGAF